MMKEGKEGVRSGVRRGTRSGGGIGKSRSEGKYWQ